MSVLSKDLGFPVLIAAKVATTTFPLPELGWWQSEAQTWLSTVSKSFKIDQESLPDSPTPDDVHAFASSISETSYPTIVQALLTASLAQPSTSDASLGYSASSRAFLFTTLTLLDIPVSLLYDAEHTLSEELFKQARDDMKTRVEDERKQKEEGWGGKWGRVGATVGGVVLGGVAIGLTGGLAAPALLPLLPFLSAGAAPAVLGSLFGLAGGGLTGYRVRRRWAGVETFEFVEISGPGELIKEGDEKLKQSEAKKPPSLVATMMIPGLQFNSETESLESFKQCLPLFAKSKQDVYVISHSPNVMLSTGKTLSGWVKSQIIGRVGAEVLKRTAINAVLAAVALPMSIYKTTGMVVDNDWIRGCDKARKAGLLLADVLRDRVQGNRPVVLIGSSLGALALFETLLSLASTSLPHEAPLVDMAIFISLPAAPSVDEWKKVRGVVGRRVVNAYTSSDFVLAGVARLHEIIGGVNIGAVVSMAGLAPTGETVPFVEDIDLGGENGILKGHFDIAEKMPEILARLSI